jgi:hypothetical protein
VIYEVKRRYKRFRVEQMNIRAKTLFAVEAELLNISVGGACIRAEQSLKVTDKQLVSLKSGKTPLTFPCSVVWEDVVSNADEFAGKSAPRYRAGVSFTHMPPDKLVKLKDFIRQSGIPYAQRVSDIHKPSLLRFLIHTNNKAVVYYRETLPVKKIGLGGMLIEVPCDLQQGKVFPMELFIPDENAAIRFRGRIASHRPVPGGEPGHFDIGIEFLDMAVLDKFRLSKFLLFSRIPGEA